MTTATLPPAAASATPIAVPLSTQLAMLVRLFAIQGAWNYETLVGNGVGFCVEPALRRLPGGVDGEAYRSALARQSQYFNAHPYMASVAVGALARAELDGEPPARIERFRTALCGPLGAVGDRLVWASYLPLCSFIALLVFGLGAAPLTVLVTFLGLYNAGHLLIRVWGLRAGLRHGLQVARSLGHPLLQNAPTQIGRLASALAGMALPLALDRVIEPGRALLGVVLLGVVVGAFLFARLQGRVEGWKVAIVVLCGSVLFAVLQ